MSENIDTMQALFSQHIQQERRDVSGVVTCCLPFWCPVCSARFVSRRYDVGIGERNHSGV